MTVVDVVGIVLGVMSVVIIPILVLIVRISIRWTKVETNMDALANSLKDLVDVKDKVHAEMLTTMREDRAVTDRRLRWLEEHLWNVRQGRNAA